MNKLYIVLIVFLVAATLGSALSNEDLRWLSDREQFHIAMKHADAILDKANSGGKDDLQAVLYYAQRSDQPGLAMLCHKRLASEYHSLEDALQWLLLNQEAETDSLEFAREIEALQASFADSTDAIIFSFYANNTPEAEILDAVSRMPKYNSVIEAMAKGVIDEISIQSSDSLALVMINEFEESFPHSIHSQIAYYYKLYHLSARKDWNGLKTAIEASGSRDPVHAYISSLYWMSPSFRKEQSMQIDALDIADKLLNMAKSKQDQLLLYDRYTPADWNSRVAMQSIKTDYYKLLATAGFYGDEPISSYSTLFPKSKVSKILKKTNSIQFSNNDRGEIAELNYWRGKICFLAKDKKYQLLAARYFCEAQRFGSPRRKFDNDATAALAAIHSELKISDSFITWLRKLNKYQGITFEDETTACGLNAKRYTRISIGDYNSDGMNDLLFNGKFLYRNEGNWQFTDTSAEANLDSLNSNGGLFADFNLDGKLDLVSLSHAENGQGEQLMKNMDNSRYVGVNERAGDIDDRFPTEAAAWVDIEQNGYPSLYMANYEKWQQQSGYPDFFWYNNKGYFSDYSQRRGFLHPEYTKEPGQAGRGVAPADFDNDGIQEILVTNYRLNRNFCWKQADSLYVDVAALYGLAGNFKQGYYGHSIGADWGDIDNDGDLDLFIANLAHPRYLDISDISILLRNDGLACKVVEGDSIYYWQFTDITANAGITYDELHSDPLFFDADNDGFLDLFITSVYENDRSYLYHNNGDNTFTDVTWLAGARVFNGWGNACADLDRDGFLDLVVGSGNGAKVLRNSTSTFSSSISIKPVWKSGEIILERDVQKFGQLPQSPAFGTRVQVTVQPPKGKKYTLTRELSSAKGTASQNAAELHFGIGKGKVIEVKRFSP